MVTLVKYLYRLDMTQVVLIGGFLGAWVAVAYCLVMSVVNLLERGG